MVFARGGERTCESCREFNDKSPCVLPDCRITSLWLSRHGGAGDHELKVMTTAAATSLLQ